MAAPTRDGDPIQYLLDRQGLHDLIGRYSRAIDDRDLNGLTACFTPDGEFGSARAGVAARGRADIRRYYAEVLRGYGMSIHVPHWQVVDSIDGDEATGWVLGHAELEIGERHVVTTMRYEDRYRRVDGAWAFAARQTSFNYFIDSEDLAQGVVTGQRIVGRREGPGTDLPESLETYRSFREATHSPDAAQNNS